MRQLLIFAGCISIALSVRATEPPYAHEVSKWEEIKVPRARNWGDYEAWSCATNRSPYEWHVYACQDVVCAERDSSQRPAREPRPKFTPKADGFRGASSFAAVDDGWLVGFNEGEFGAGLYWFSDDGRKKYKISHHQVVDFFTLPDGVHAIEGLVHLGMSEGSVIRIARRLPGARWEATTTKKLPFAPYAISVASNGTMLITLSDVLISLRRGWKTHTLLSKPPWLLLYPNSSVLSRNEKKLYIGMRQFVGEFDRETGKFRLLVPSRAFLNKLPAQEDQEIRRIGAKYPPP
jgi:hypothetical protein